MHWKCRSLDSIQKKKRCSCRMYRSLFSVLRYCQEHTRISSPPPPPPPPSASLRYLCSTYNGCLLFFRPFQHRWGPAVWTGVHGEPLPELWPAVQVSPGHVAPQKEMRGELPFGLHCLWETVLPAWQVQPPSTARSFYSGIADRLDWSDWIYPYLLIHALLPRGGVLLPS